jgi:hypothetical protein
MLNDEELKEWYKIYTVDKHKEAIERHFQELVTLFNSIINNPNIIPHSDSFSFEITEDDIGRQCIKFLNKICITELGELIYYEGEVYGKYEFREYKNDKEFDVLLTILIESSKRLYLRNINDEIGIVDEYGAEKVLRNLLPNFFCELTSESTTDEVIP